MHFDPAIAALKVLILKKQLDENLKMQVQKAHSGAGQNIKELLKTQMSNLGRESLNYALLVQWNNMQSLKTIRWVLACVSQ